MNFSVLSCVDLFYSDISVPFHLFKSLSVHSLIPLNIFIIIILTFCPLASLFAQDKYEIFRKEMFLIEKQENEYRKVIWGENDFSQDYKDSVYKKHQVLVKEKVEFAKNTIRENRDDERFLKVLDIYVRNFLSLDEFEAELKMFSFQH